MKMSNKYNLENNELCYLMNNVQSQHLEMKSILSRYRRKLTRKSVKSH